MTILDSKQSDDSIGIVMICVFSFFSVCHCVWKIKKNDSVSYFDSIGSSRKLNLTLGVESRKSLELLKIYREYFALIINKKDFFFNF